MSMSSFGAGASQEAILPTWLNVGIKPKFTIYNLSEAAEGSLEGDATFMFQISLFLKKNLFLSAFIIKH